MSTRLHRFFSSPGVGILFLLLLATLQGFASVSVQFNGVVSIIDTTTAASPHGVASDASGNVYIADSTGKIVKVTSDGSASVLSISGLGQGLANPTGVALDSSSGTLYIADTNNSRIVTVDPTTGTGSVLVTTGFTLSAPEGVAVDPSGNIFISDTGNNRILKVSFGGGVSLLSTSGLSLATLTSPRGLATDTFGSLYIADRDNNRIVKVTPGGVGSNFSASGGTALTSPVAVSASNSGNVYVGDTGGNRVVILHAQGGNTVLPTGATSLSAPSGVALSPMGRVYVADSGNSRVLAIDAGSAGFRSVLLGGAGTSLSLPFSVGPGTTLSSVKAYSAGRENLDFTIANTSTCAAATTNADCTVDVVFSPAAPGLRPGALVLAYDSGSLTVPLYAYADAPLAALSPAVASVVNVGNAVIPMPYQTAVDGAGNIYLGSYNNGKLYFIPAGGGQETLVATPGLTLNQVTGLALDGAGNLFVADYGNSRIVNIAANGTASVLVINGLSQPVRYPTQLSFDGAGNLWITDYGNGRFVKVSPSPDGDGTVANGTGTVVATGTYSFSANTITGTTVDSKGNLYIADRMANPGRILKVLPSGKVAVVSLPGITLNNPQGVAVDRFDNLYIVDTGNKRLVRVTTTGDVSAIPFSGVQMGPTVFGVTPDATGNLLVADWSSSRILKIDVGQSKLSFTSTKVGATSTDSPKIASVTNLGSKDLVFAAQPAYTADFSQDSSDTNPVTSNTILTPGTSANVAVKFTPQSVGPLNANIALRHNSQNTVDAQSAPNAVQEIAVSGTGINPGDTTSVTVVPTPSTLKLGQSLSLTATVQDTTSGHQATVPTGAVSFVETFGSTIVSLNGGSAVTLDSQGRAVLNGVRLTGAGAHTITADYPGVNLSFLASSNTITVMVDKADVTVSGPGTQPAQVTTGQSGSVVVTVTGVSGVAIPTGTLNYHVLDSSNASVASGSLSLTAAGSAAGATVPLANTLPSGSYTVSVTYDGDASYASSAAPLAIPVQVGRINPTIRWSQPAAITYGTTLSGLLNASATNGENPVAGSFTYTATPTSGNGSAVASASVLAAGNYTLAATFNPTDSTTYASATGSVSLVVNKATPAVSLVSSANPVLVTTPVAFAATVLLAAATPSGTITFHDGTTELGTVTLSQGTASYSTSALAAETHSITATYSGDNNYTAVTSSALTELVQDYTLSIGGTGGNGSGPGGGTDSSQVSQTVMPGGTATYTLALGPSNGTEFPEAVTLSVTGVPPGATATLSPQTLPAGSSLTNVTLTVQLPRAMARSRVHPLGTMPMAVGVLLLPFGARAGRAAGRRARKVCLVLMLLAGAAGVLGLSACGAPGSGQFAQAPQTYTLTITATSGTLSHSSTVNLTVQ